MPVDNMTRAYNAIEAVEDAAIRLGECRAGEMQLEDERGLLKAAATKRIMARDNIAATNAEKIVESDEEYANHRKAQRLAVIATETARGAFYSARFRAELCIAAVKEESWQAR